MPRRLTNALDADLDRPSPVIELIAARLFRLDFPEDDSWKNRRRYRETTYLRYVTMAEGYARAIAGAEIPAAVAAEQAEDEGLWFQPVYASEAYLQAALRRLHEAVEGKTSAECARAKLD